MSQGLLFFRSLTVAARFFQPCALASGVAPVRSTRFIVPVAFALFFMVLVPACRSTHLSPRIISVEPSTRHADASSRSFATATQELAAAPIRLAGAINETIDFRILVQAGDVDIEDPQLFMTSFRSAKGDIESAAARIFRGHRVQLGRWPGWHVRSISPDRRSPSPMDVLVPIHAPRNGLPSRLKAQADYWFWIDVTIPKTAGPGLYRAEIILAAGEKTLAVQAVELTVWAFGLPDESSVTALADLDYRKLAAHHLRRRGRPLQILDDWRGANYQNELEALLDRTMRMLASHRVTSALPGLKPLVKVTARDTLTLDWELFDAVTGPSLDGSRFFSRLPARYWPLPVSEILDGQARPTSVRRPFSNTMGLSYVAACRSHLEERGWLDRSYAIVPDGGVSAKKAAERTKRFSELLRSAGEGIAVVSPLFPQDMKPFGWTGFVHTDLTDYVDIWMPPAQFYDPDIMRQQRDAGRRCWFSVDRPPFSGTHSAFAPATYLRVLAWQAFQFEAEAFHLGTINNWPPARDTPTPTACIRTDEHTLIYPGSFAGLDEPLPSVRLKRLRRSLQDAAYLALLGEHRLEHLARAVADAICHYAGTDAYRSHFADGRSPGWIEDPSVFSLAREVMARELIRQTNPSSSHRVGDDFTRSVDWKRLMAKTRAVHLRVDGVRAHLDASSAVWSLEIETSLALNNRSRVPVAGWVGPSELGVGSADSEEGVRIVDVRPNGSRRVVLRSHAETLRTGPSGHVSTPIEFRQESTSPIRAVATLSLVTANARQQQVRVDGDLSEWPLDEGNVFSDFTLIAGGNPDSQAVPKNATVGFVMRDAEFLYIAVNCSGGLPVEELHTRRNRVQYDDMIPTGQELIEILVDPLNTGTRSPSDLYHIVIKQSGPDFTERGVRFDPPCGESAPWSPDIEVATRVRPDRWTVELRIPLAAFGLEPRQQTIWGFNVTRFDAVNQEFSTWSGAKRNAYDPLSLGNLLIP